MKLVKPRGGVEPCARGYHSLTAVGRRLFVFGGRASSADPPVRTPLAIYDIADKHWEMPGAPPLLRSTPPLPPLLPQIAA